ncbi:gamma-glutamyl-gamma-aminobutyrate hydrolase [Brevirhabdus pacifica]|uniref:Gamma-glutamyl-gamma-aminobutyrate hydrolase n=1 Tax=Brevirhabdus pacifica TaxID=1267768 RepID=A0A1U7DIH1_9RHOB|nr:gamma-glutamyl-gamma-aminobutyrate hydrolase family protein [Brevirhabdus pacifica]APX89683.1 gamma-glutamyl-gamma-aminobutyrate hydrolase [Brevirhabdus pacifica]OWU74528.1 glutamine amidotransferase [Loktanella sp. 22II-4b]PJJ85636.1 putative glutamine amidotransferase [Brevirhabdus pacifica]
MRPASSRPVVGVTVSQRSGWRIFPLIAFNIWLAGGRALRWQAGSPANVAAVDGVVIGGGDDISPDLYGGHIVTSARLDPDRDTLERGLIEQALALNVPVLGICRGAQMLNIALGGTLDQDAYGTYWSGERVYTILPRKRVEICADTQLARISGQEPMQVNALHSQAVEELGRGLRVAARDERGMVQAVERIADPFAMGVQWHPEHLFYRRRHRLIFAALVEAARAHRLQRDQIAAMEAGLAGANAR